MRAKIEISRDWGAQMPVRQSYDLTPEDYAFLEQHKRELAAKAAPQIDSQRTPVFQTGPDGKLHPIAGWRTTGPLDVGTWAKNINWIGVARDNGKIVGGAGSAVFPRVAGQIADAYVVGDDALDDLEKAQNLPKNT